MKLAVRLGVLRGGSDLGIGEDADVELSGLLGLIVEPETGEIFSIWGMPNAPKVAKA